jgi:anti-anti-sigma regulatory factor/anti-sigma regulatory factor (Ser/Thr protein kinase)
MPGFTLTSYTHQGCAVVTLRGALAVGAGAQLLVRLQRVLADRPSFVVVDVSGVTEADAGVAQVLVDLRAQASRWPGVSCMLVDEDAGVVARLLSRNGSEVLPRLLSVVAALHASTAAGLPRVARMLLPAEHTSPWRARQFVAEWCREWEIDALAWSATLTASELVTNAVLHSTGSHELALAYRKGALRLSVRDGQGDPPVQLRPGTDDETGRGLNLVRALVDDWGVLPTDEGGKVVWCRLGPVSSAQEALAPAAS